MSIGVRADHRTSGRAGSHKPQAPIRYTTTLYDVITVLQELVGPEDAVVVDTLRRLLHIRRLTHRTPTSRPRPAIANTDRATASETGHRQGGGEGRDSARHPPRLVNAPAPPSRGECVYRTGPARRAVLWPASPPAGGVEVVRPLQGPLGGQRSIARSCPGGVGISFEDGGPQMISTPLHATVNAWLAWFDTQEYARCHAGLRARYGFDAHEADSLINAARFQVFRHWDRLTVPLAYFRTVLKHEVQQALRRRQEAQNLLEAYAWQVRRHRTLTARTATAVAAVLEQVPGPQRQLLQWFLAGYADAQVAAWVGTTPQAVRKARSEAYRTVRRRVRG